MPCDWSSWLDHLRAASVHACAGQLITDLMHELTTAAATAVPQQCLLQQALVSRAVCNCDQRASASLKGIHLAVVLHQTYLLKSAWTAVRAGVKAVGLHAVQHSVMNSVCPSRCLPVSSCCKGSTDVCLAMPLHSPQASSTSSGLSVGTSSSPAPASPLQVLRRPAPPRPQPVRLPEAGGCVTWRHGHALQACGLP